MRDQTASIEGGKRNYPLLLASQFLSAFGDNLILVVILGPLLTLRSKGAITEQAQSIANVYYTSLLFVPYVLLAPLAGYLNDRFSKNRGLMGGNFIKLIGAAITAYGSVSNKVFLDAGYFIVGIGACVYSPAKYGILPEILPKERLVKGNGLLELLTFVAILTGNIGGSMAFDRFSPAICYGITIGIYALSLVFNLFMTRTPSFREVQFKGSFGEFFGNLRELFSQKRLARVIAGTALFWVCGAILKMSFQPWGEQVLKLQTMTAISLLGLWLSIGVMAGSVLAGQLYKIGDLHATQRYGWLLAAGIAGLGCIGSILATGFSHPMALAAVVLILTGVIAGLFLIPLNAALQAESHNDRLGKTIATQNGLENLAMLGGAVIAYLDIRIGFNTSELLLVLAALAAVIVIFLKIPEKSAVTGNT